MGWTPEKKKNFVLPTRKLTKVCWKGTILTAKFIFQPSIFSKYLNFQRGMFISPLGKMKCSKFSTRDPCLLFFIQRYFSQLASKLVFCLNQGCTKFEPRIKTCSSRNQIFHIGSLGENQKTIMTLQLKEKTSQQHLGWKLVFQPLNLHNSFWRSWCAVKTSGLLTSRFLAPRKSPRKIQPAVEENSFSFEKQFWQENPVESLEGNSFNHIPPK